MPKLAPALLTLIFTFHIGIAQDTAAFRYARKITADDVRPYLEVLASDSLEGRETGKQGQKKAAAYIAGVFQSIGLQGIVHNGYFQHTSLSARANKGKSFQVNEKFFVFMRDYFYPPGMSDSLIVISKAVFAGNGICRSEYNDYKGLELKNNAVLFFGENPENKKAIARISTPPGLSEKIRDAKERGASVVLIITDSLEKIIDDFSYGNSGPLTSEVPFAFITREMAGSFFSMGKGGKFEKIIKRNERTGKPGGISDSSNAILSFVKNTDGLRGENVLGFLEGTDKKEEAIVLTAHYDHLGIRDSLIYYGADDDGSGTTAVLEMAKLFSEAAKDGSRPRRSILFMTVSGEEKGLLGSSYYVSHPIVPLSNTIADLNTDMIGRTDAKHDSLGVREYVYIIGSDKLSTTLHRINENANASFTGLELDYSFNRPDDPNRFYYRSDHYNFAKKNIPIIFYFNGSHADYHKPSDTIDKIQFDLLAKRTQLIFLTAWELANRAERIPLDVESDMPNK